jgi:hypothetical protein
MAAKSASARPLIAAGLAAAVALGLAAALPWRAAAAGEPAYAVSGAATAGALGAVAVIVAVAAAWERLVAWGLAFLATEYAVALTGGSAGPDLAAPVVGALVVVVAELSHAACEWRGPHAVDAATELGRWLRLGATALIGFLVGMAALALRSSIGALPPAAVLVGFAAVVAVVVLMATLHGRWQRGVSPRP